MKPTNKSHRILSYKSPIFTAEMFIQVSVLGIILLYIWHSSRETSIVYLAPTIDALFSAVGFFRINMIQNLTKSQTLNQLRSLYHPSLLDRYLYYFCLSFIYQVALVITWGYFRQIIYYSLIISLCPIFLNRILSESLEGVSIWFNSEKIRIIKIGVSKLVAYLINFMSEVSVNLRPEVQYTELMPLFRNRHQTLKFFYSFLTSFLLATLIHYIKSNGNHIYARVIRYFYNYKTGDHFGGINEAKAKEKFTDVIVHRRWDELLRPDVTQTLFYIYKNNEDSDIIKNLVTKFHYTSLKISAIWTISWFFKYGEIVPVLSAILLLFEHLRQNNIVSCSHKGVEQPIQKTSQKNKIYVEDYTHHTSIMMKPLIFKLLFPVIAFVISHYTEYRHKYLYLAIFSELGIFVTNILFLSCINFFIEKIKEWIGILSSYKDLDLFLLTTCMYLKIINYYGFVKIFLNINLERFKEYVLINALFQWNYLHMQNYIIQIEVEIAIWLSVIYLLINCDELPKRYLVFFLSFLGNLSGFNNWHLGFMIFVGHIVLNLIYFFRPHYLVEKIVLENYEKLSKGNVNKIGVQINTDTLKIYDSYYPNYAKRQNYTRENVIEQDTQYKITNRERLDDNTIVNSYQNNTGIRRHPVSLKILSNVNSLEHNLPLGMNSELDMCRSIYLERSKKFKGKDLSKSS